MMQSTRASRAPWVQPKRVISQPPARGPSIMGTRRIIDWTPMPIVWWRASSEVATTEKVAGRDKALQARNSSAPSNAGAP